jgi:UDP-N-acetylmuramate dehydrogenase
VCRLKEWKRKINIRGELRADEPLADHTTFRVGGPADLYALPQTRDDLKTLLRAARRDSVPTFLLGGGANILVSDRGFRGLVIDMGRFDSIRHSGDLLEVGAGASISDAAAFAADHGLQGLEFIYSMPGSAGGAVWMNARCYGGEIVQVLHHVDLVTPDGGDRRYLTDSRDFEYKKSPFQRSADAMVSIGFTVLDGDRDGLWQQMREYEADRRAKGHFDLPCAGSVFKNNRAFGMPSGKIIDDAGLRGTRVGGAQVSDRHANIVVNTGTATADEIRSLIERIEQQVALKTGYRLEREVLLVGDWEDS